MKLACMAFVAASTLMSFARAEAPPRTEAAAPTPRTRRYADVKAQLTALAARYPGVVKIFDLGPSDSGDRVIGVAIGDQASALRNIVVSTHHGNEYGSTEVALGFAESLAEKPIAGQLVYVIPVLNVGGYDSRTRWEKDAGGHYRDPNRDYPGPCGTEGPFHLKDTHALADFIERQGIVASATLHTFYPAVVWPWGIPARDLETPWTSQYRDLAAAATMDSHYEIGNSTDVIYAATGAYEDYAYWKLGAWSLLFEVGHSHTPSDADVAQLVALNVPGLRRMMERAPRERAPTHGFDSVCDSSRARFDRHDE